LTCVHNPGRCSYEEFDIQADGYAGKTLSELEDWLAVLIDDCSVPLSGKVAVALVW
jgi:hypothetical protein